MWCFLVFERTLLFLFFFSPYVVSDSLRAHGLQQSSLLRFISTDSVMLSNHFILCHSLLLLPSVFPSIRVFCSESALRIRWRKYWSFSFSISLSNEYSKLISFWIDWFILLAVQRTFQSLLQNYSSKASIVQSQAKLDKMYSFPLVHFMNLVMESSFFK